MSTDRKKMTGTVIQKEKKAIQNISTGPASYFPPLPPLSAFGDSPSFATSPSSFDELSSKKKAATRNYAIMPI
jgi:hypothetical protein